MQKVPLEKVTKEMTLVCDQCEKVLKGNEPGYSLWRYDEQNDRVLCPSCVADIKEKEINEEVGKVFSFIEGARWALSIFYDEQMGTERPPHIENEIKEKLKEMLFKAVKKVEEKYKDR